MRLQMLGFGHWVELGCRVPLYGPLNELVDSSIVTEWVMKLLRLPNVNSTLLLALMQLSRNTHDRYRDIEQGARSKVIDFMKLHRASPHFIQLVENGGALDEEEQSEVFGESLPKGLKLI